MGKREQKDLVYDFNVYDLSNFMWKCETRKYLCSDLMPNDVVCHVDKPEICRANTGVSYFH